jgi:hypothetical protein
LPPCRDNERRDRREDRRDNRRPDRDEAERRQKTKNDWRNLALASGVLAAPRAQHVFIISFDGGKPAVMQESRMPTLLAMVAQGAHTWGAQTIFPSIPLVSHTSMLTGVGPDKHKVLWNSWQPDKGLVPVPTARGTSTAGARPSRRERSRRRMRPSQSFARRSRRPASPRPVSSS